MSAYFINFRGSQSCYLAMMLSLQRSTWTHSSPQDMGQLPAAKIPSMRTLIFGPCQIYTSGKPLVGLLVYHLQRKCVNDRKHCLTIAIYWFRWKPKWSHHVRRPTRNQPLWEWKHDIMDFVLIQFMTKKQTAIWIWRLWIMLKNTEKDLTKSLSHFGVKHYGFLCGSCASFLCIFTSSWINITTTTFFVHL